MKVTRRGFLASGIAASALGGSLKSFAFPSPQNTNRKRKNVLLIMADQHQRHAMGAAGDPVAKTPNLDSLANSGVMFDDAYCPDPVCVPSRPSMLTGMYVHNLKPYGTWPHVCKTIAHHFDRAGYMSALVGKMHFLDARTHGFDYHLGFKDWYEYLGPRAKMYAEETYYPDSGEGLPDNDDLWRESGDPWTGVIERDFRQGWAVPGRISSLPEEDHFESFVARESIRFLNNFGKEQPFFMVSSFLKPHAPWMPAERFGNMFHPQDMKLPDSWGKVNLDTVPKFIREAIQYPRVTPELRDPEQAKIRIAMYYASLAQMDDNVGKILKALKDMGLEKDTIVLYTSDHGEMLGQHGLWQKFVFYEASSGVPLLFRVPGVTPQRVRCKTPVSLVQLLPTLAELCDVPVTTPIDGKSFATSLRAPEKQLDMSVFVEHSLGTKEAGYMLRYGQYKYCFYVNDMPELYDLASDPEEMKNLALLPAYASKVAEMKNQLFAWHMPEELQQR